MDSGNKHRLSIMKALDALEDADLPVFLEKANEEDRETQLPPQATRVNWQEGQE